MGLEAGEPHSVAVGLQLAGRHHDARVGRLDVLALRVAVERDGGVEDLDVAALEDPGRAGPLRLVAEGLVLEDLARDTLGEHQSAVGPAAVLGTLVGGDVGLPEEVAELGVGVPVIESQVAVSDEGEDDLPALVAVLVRGRVGERPGVPHPYASAAHVGEGDGHRGGGELLRHRVLPRAGGGVGHRLELAGVRTRPPGREVRVGHVGDLAVHGRLGKAFYGPWVALCRVRLCSGGGAGEHQSEERQQGEPPAQLFDEH